MTGSACRGVRLLQTRDPHQFAPRCGHDAAGDGREEDRIKGKGHPGRFLFPYSPLWQDQRNEANLVRRQVGADSVCYCQRSLGLKDRQPHRRRDKSGAHILK